MWFDRKINPKKIKNKNTRKLRSEGLDIIDHLPSLDKPEFRDSEEVARRMMTLLALFQLHLRAPNDIIKKWLNDNKLISDLRGQEFEYLESKYTNLPRQTQTDIYWFVEAIWAFAWVGGLHNNLTLNTGVEDSLATMTPNIQKNESSAEFVSKFRLRSQLDIFEMLDKFYRAHWSARNNQMTGKRPKANLDIIVPRRKALEYTCFKRVEWDEMTLDT
jgi:hypothetical protein